MLKVDTTKENQLLTQVKIDYERMVEGMKQLVDLRRGDKRKLEAQIQEMKKVYESVIS